MEVTSREKIVTQMCYTWQHDYEILEECERTSLYRRMDQIFEHHIKPLIDLKADVACNICNGTSFKHNLLEKGTWMGTKSLPPEFFGKSEFDFGFDYYPKKDTLMTTCESCGHVSYSLPKQNESSKSSGPKIG